MTQGDKACGHMDGTAFRPMLIQLFLEVPPLTLCGASNIHCLPDQQRWRDLSSLSKVPLLRIRTRRHIATCLSFRKTTAVIA